MEKDRKCLIFGRDKTPVENKHNLLKKNNNK